MAGTKAVRPVFFPVRNRRVKCTGLLADTVYSDRTGRYGTELITLICIALVASKSMQLIIFTKIKKYAINIRVTELNIGHKIEYVFYNYFLSTFSTRVERKGYTFFPCEHLYCPLVHCPVQSLGFIPGHLAIWPGSTVLAFFFFFFI